jgi:hypothetical protein
MLQLQDHGATGRSSCCCLLSCMLSGMKCSTSPALLQLEDGNGPQAQLLLLLSCLLGLKP